jgi:hypothetical protein
MKHFLPKLILFKCLLVFSTNCISQDSLKQVYLGVNYARHGSGDMDGVLVNIDYNHYYNSRISIVYNLGFSLHGQKAYPVVIKNNPSTPSDLQTEVPTWVTSGLQIGGLFTYNFSKTNYSGFKLGLGPILRYQLNSYPDRYVYYGESNPWYQQPFYVFQETDNNMFNVGYNIRATYDLKSKKRNNFGVILFFQNDTNADLLAGFGLKCGLNIK